MNYVGQLAGSVLGRVRDLYKGVNPATLSGAIDVIVVQQPDGSFRSSPFHVRFGKLGILRSAEMAVDIEVNGEPVDLQMRLGENGEAFFIQEMEEDEEHDPPITPSPHCLDLSSTYVSKDITEAPRAVDPTLCTMDTPARRQRWSNRRKRSRGDETLGAQDKDGVGMPPLCDSIYFSFSDPPEECSPSLCKDFHTYYKEDLLQLSTSSRSPSPKSDSELEMKTPNTPLPENCMEWNWGRLPQVSRSDTCSQISQSAPPSPTRELVEIPSAASADPELLHTTAEEDGTFRIVLVEGSDDAPELQVPPDVPSASLIFSPQEALSPDSEEVSLYFPNSEPHPPPPPLLNNSVTLADNDMESPMSCVALSLCGGLADSWNISEERFQKYRISYSDFCQNPSLIDNPRLVLQIHNKFYNWATAAPIVLCMQAFNQELPQGVIEQLTQQRMPPQSRGWWFSWRRRSLPNQPSPKDYVETKEDPVLNGSEANVQLATEPSAAPVQPCPYRRSLRLTSEQIRSLNLHSGANEVVFSVCTKFQGTCRTRAQIFLWDCTDRIIVSDIDGTVTRSDALGHILPQLGKDWTQPGIVQLYNAIYKNDYKFLYCSARSVGMADITKTFLQGVSEGGYTLPPGPLLLSPSSLFTALHREVIEKAPERFKIACLSDIRLLFTDPSPFHTAFGNRPNDVLAYREVGVPESRIFTVNPRGELTVDLNSSFKSSYSGLCDVVNAMFPPPSSHSMSALLSPQFNDFSYWREPVVSISEDELVDFY